MAVKVQHPKVQAHSLIDMWTMGFLVSMVDKSFEDFDFMWLAEGTKKNLPLELDFVNEGKNAEKVQKLFGSRLKWLKIPGVHWDYTTPR